ncbi:MAG: sigma-70 family RNA polymerase sigma factor [Prevotella sp.]|nr:sigma-70 family RNA polymerase sigma factor [Prevotella sp.]
MTKDEFQQAAVAIRPRIEGIAMHVLNNHDEAEDITQDVLTKLWTMCDSLHAPLLPLASVMTRNLSLDRRRRLSAYPSLSWADAGDAEGERQDSEQIERMMALVDAMPMPQQLVIRLRHMQDMDYADIARLMGTTETAVRKAVSRARKTIRDEIMKGYRS